MKYVLIHTSDDGVAVSWLNESEVRNITELKEDYGVERFITEGGNGNNNPSNWHMGDAMLLEVKILGVRAKDVVQTWELFEA